MSRRIVVDTSPLIGLQRIDQSHLLPALCEEIMAPSAVLREYARRATVPNWLLERQIEGRIDVPITNVLLGAGEREAIALARQLNVDHLLIDEESARRVALSLGLPVNGTLGVLVLAKRHGQISHIGPLIEALTRANFRLAQRLIERVLSDAGE